MANCACMLFSHTDLTTRRRQLATENVRYHVILLSWSDAVQ